MESRQTCKPLVARRAVQGIRQRSSSVLYCLLLPGAPFPRREPAGIWITCRERREHRMNGQYFRAHRAKKRGGCSTAGTTRYGPGTNRSYTTVCSLSRYEIVGGAPEPNTFQRSPSWCQDHGGHQESYGIVMLYSFIRVVFLLGFLRLN